MAFTRSWDSSYEAVPATGDNLNEGAGVIRNEKLDTRERAQVDHHWSTLVSDTDTGYHRKLTLVGQTDPTAVASTAILFFDSADSKIKAIFADGTIIEFASTAGHFADTISEQTSATGVTIDGVLLKDSQVKTDTIIEKTAAAGVTADSVLLKDGGVSGAGVIAMTDATDASSSTTGAVKTAGGLGVAKKVYVGTDLNVGGTLAVTGATTLGALAAAGWPSVWAWLNGNLTTKNFTTADELNEDAAIAADWSELYDTNSNFVSGAGAGCGRFTPTVAGKYLAVMHCNISGWTPGSGANLSTLEIRKNGSTSAGSRVRSEEHTS